MEYISKDQSAYIYRELFAAPWHVIRIGFFQRELELTWPIVLEVLRAEVAIRLRCPCRIRPFQLPDEMPF